MSRDTRLAEFAELSATISPSTASHLKHPQPHSGTEWAQCTSAGIFVNAPISAPVEFERLQLQTRFTQEVARLANQLGVASLRQTGNNRRRRNGTIRHSRILAQIAGLLSRAVPGSANDLPGGCSVALIHRVNLHLQQHQRVVPSACADSGSPCCADPLLSAALKRATRVDEL